MQAGCKGDVLVIDGNPSRIRLLTHILGHEGYTVRRAVLAAEGRDAWGADLVAVVVASRLPDGDGLALVVSKGRDLPVIVLGEPGDRRPAFEAGAAAYMEEPLDHALLTYELAAHVRDWRKAIGVGDTVRLGRLELDARNHVIRQGDRAVALTPNECSLFGLMLRQPGRVFTVDALLVEALDYPPKMGSPEIVRTHVRHLRLKLEADPANPALILNLPRVGYMVSVAGCI